MDMSELQQGLQNIQQQEDISQAQGDSWLNMDNLMQGYGGWFGNDKGLGELLLGQLRAKGVDTQAATEAMLRELLQGLVSDLNLLQQKLTGFTSAIAQQMQQTQAVADSIQSALDIQQPDTTATSIEPPNTQMPIMNDIPPEMGGEQMQPEMNGEQMQPEMGGEQMQPEMNGEQMQPEMNGEQMQPEMNGEQMQPEMGGGTPSDKRLKSIKQIVSDRRAKVIRKPLRKQKAVGNTLNKNILAACRGGF